MNARNIAASVSARPALRDLSDDALVAALRAGSRAALGEIYRRQAPRLGRFVARHASPCDIDDVVQSVFLVALGGLRFTPAPGRTQAWLRGVAVRIARKRRAERSEEVVTDADAMIADRWIEDEGEG